MRSERTPSAKISSRTKLPRGPVREHPDAFAGRLDGRREVAGRGKIRGEVPPHFVQRGTRGERFFP
jgi:hypothetical protein